MVAQKKISMTGDISPGYSILKAVHLGNIRKFLENAGFAVKVIFIMRDPIERNWSAYKDKFKQINPELSKKYMNILAGLQKVRSNEEKEIYHLITKKKNTSLF